MGNGLYKQNLLANFEKLQCLFRSVGVQSTGKRPGNYPENLFSRVNVQKSVIKQENLNGLHNLSPLTTDQFIWLRFHPKLLTDFTKSHPAIAE